MVESSPSRPSVQQVLRTTEEFFSPAIADRNDNNYIVNKLASPHEADDALRLRYLHKAGELLQSLHSALVFEQASQGQGQSYDSSLLLALYKLLDFLVLEGVYPSMPPGIGLLPERRAKSLFYTKTDPAYTPIRGSNQLEHILEYILEPILTDLDIGVEPLIRHRIFSDITTGYACLSHEDGKSVFPPPYSTYLER